MTKEQSIVHLCHGYGGTFVSKFVQKHAKILANVGAGVIKRVFPPEYHQENPHAVIVSHCRLCLMYPHSPVSEKPFARLEKIVQMSKE